MLVGTKGLRPIFNMNPFRTIFEIFYVQKKGSLTAYNKLCFEFDQRSSDWLF
jgi:hypothetical protein